MLREAARRKNPNRGWALCLSLAELIPIPAALYFRALTGIDLLSTEEGGYAILVAIGLGAFPLFALPIPFHSRALWAIAYRWGCLNLVWLTAMMFASPYQRSGPCRQAHPCSGSVPDRAGRR